MKKHLVTFCLIFLFGLAACSGASTGGAEAGNPPSARALAGTLPLEESACQADGVVATDSSGETITADVASDCSFSIELTIGKAYVVSFIKSDSFVASMIFNNGPGTLPSSVLVVSSGEAAILLGNITITDGVATPENEPAEQNDQDEDGVDDFEDDDDDGDEVSDDEEEDCDLDGFTDGLDEDDDCEAEEESDDESGDSDDDDSDNDNSGENATVLDRTSGNH